MNKKKILAPLFIAASFLIVGCSASDITARPSWIDEAIISGDFKDNKMKEIYDAIKELGGTNENVLNKVMYDIAKKQLGSLEELMESRTITDINKMNEFVAAHPMYAPDEFGFTRDGEELTKTNLDDSQKLTNFVSKIDSQLNRIREDICRKLFDEIKGGSYSTKIDKFFEEEYFIDYLYKEMYYEGTYPVPSTTPLITDAVFFPKPAHNVINEEMSWFDFVNAAEASKDKGYLHIFKDDGATFTDFYKNYIERKILPEIYRSLLIENYVKEQRYTNLGRSYARKINMIAIPRPTGEGQGVIDANIKQMMTNYAQNRLLDAKEPNTIFENLNIAMIGFAGIDGPKETPSMHEAFGLLDPVFKNDKLMFDENTPFVWKIRTNEAGHVPTGTDQDPFFSTYVYKGTKLYDIVEKYLKIYNVTYTADASLSYDDFTFIPKENLTSDEQAAYDDLTNKNAYSVEKGLEIKEREARATNMITDGWFLKSGGVSGLSDKYSSNLFNITTARNIDNYKKMSDEPTKKPENTDKVRYFGTDLTDKKAFLWDNQERESDAASLILSDDSNYFIVEVKEAASASKFSMDEESNSYLGLKATANLGDSNELMNEIVHNVTEKVADSDTYKKNAEQYYLMISNIIFYDDSVYEYFKSQFPDLFK